MGGMVQSADAEVQRTPCLPGFVVSADVVAEEVVREQQVPRPSPDLLGLGQIDRWVGTEHLRTVIAEVRGVCEMSARPDPEVAGVLRELVGHQDAGQERERATHWLTGRF